MADEKNKKNRRNWFSKIRLKYRLVILNDETFAEKFSFRLSTLNVFVALGTLSIFLIFVTTLLIAFTPLREYIPGYASVTGKINIYRLQQKADSLEQAMKDKDLFIYNLKNVISGREMVDALPEMVDTVKNYKNITLKTSSADSSLRAEMENADKYSIKPEGKPQASTLNNFLFFSPLKGYVTNNYDPVNLHYGIDIVAKKNEAVKASLDGRVIFADWTLGTGYTIGIQHQENLITVYKHNASLLKKLGAYVKAGEPIAFVGGSGELSSGPHLHFELWYNGNPVNPKDYISF